MAHVKLILIDDVESLGMAGDEVSVSPGYARNYLIPRKKAVQVSAAAARIFEARKAKVEEKRRQVVAEAQSLSERIAAAEIIIAMETTADENSLFGSVTARHISDVLKEKGLDVHHSRIQMLDPIKHIGTFQVPVRLAQGVAANLTVQVVKA